MGDICIIVAQLVKKENQKSERMSSLVIRLLVEAMARPGRSANEMKSATSVYGQ